MKDDLFLKLEKLRRRRNLEMIIIIILAIVLFVGGTFGIAESIYRQQLFNFLPSLTAKIISWILGFFCMAGLCFLIGLVIEWREKNHHT